MPSIELANSINSKQNNLRKSLFFFYFSLGITIKYFHTITYSLAQSILKNNVSPLLNWCTLFFNIFGILN